MTSTSKFEEDAQMAFRAILQLSSNYRVLQERCDSQEEKIRELTERLKLAEIKSPNPLATIVDISNNKVVTENPHIINKLTTIGPLECKPLKSTTIDCSNILHDKLHKSYTGAKVGEPGETVSRNIFRDRVY